MIISVYKNISSITPYENKDLYKVLEIIKSDKLKNQIAKIRLEKTKKERDKLKIKLLNATFCGKFTTRGNNNLITHSGLACLDFDNCDELENLKSIINKDKYTLASFISPSGNGLKALVKIPLVDNNDDYQDYYVELIKHYNQPKYTDEGTKDIARATFLSYDPNIYINSESETFTDKRIRKEFNTEFKEVNIPLDNEDEIVERLMIWFKKRWNASNRNTNLHALARQFNAFGINKSECIRILLQFEQTGFKKKEIESLINSAYKYSSEFNTTHFEDVKKVYKIKILTYSGETSERIQKKFPEIKKENIIKEIEKQQKDVDDNQFWYNSEKGNISIAPYRYKCYLNNNNIYKFFPSEKDGFIFIKKDGNFINEISIEKIKDYVLKDLKDKAMFEAWEMMASKTSYFSRDYLSMIETANINLSKDGRAYAYLYYKNKVVKVTKDKFELIDYDNIDGFVWENQIIKRNIKLTPESNGEYKTFVWKIAGENKEKYYTFKSVIGYLLHSYRNESKDRTIIFNDEMISDAPNGGSGKGLFHKAIGYMKSLSTLDGKSLDLKNRFAFQSVNPDSQVLLFDDVKKGFNFSDLFSITTEGINIEKKNENLIVIPFKDSPKITITTNYTIKGEGGSHKRRVFEVEMSSFFNSEYTPEDEFNKLLFTEWDEKEWHNFDNYMLRSVQFFLTKGLVMSDTVNLDKRKIIDNTNPDFFLFMEDITFEGQRYYKSELKDLFIEDYSDYKKANWFSSRIFNKWVKLYCEYNNYKLSKGKTQGDRWISIGEINNTVNKNNDGFL